MASKHERERERERESNSKRRIELYRRSVEYVLRLEMEEGNTLVSVASGLSFPAQELLVL
jgi:hypothetical protein